MRTETCDAIHIVNQMRPGGLETMVLDLTRNSAHHARIFSLEGAASEIVQAWPGLAPVATRLEGFDRVPGFVPTLAIKLARRLRQLAPNTVFLHRISPLLYGGFAARLAGVKTIVHVEHDTWHYANPSHRAILKWSARLVRPTHFAVSTPIADFLRNTLPQAQVKVVPAGVDLGRFQQVSRQQARMELGLAANAPVIGTAGRLETVKGHGVLIEAMRHLPDQVCLLIAGHGTEHGRLARMADDLGLGQRVRFLGHRDDLERILPALDVFCLPSMNEGMPRVVMEAQGADIPVVATDVGSVRHVVCPATGTLVPASDPRALAEAVSRCLASPPPKGVARAFAETNFSLVRMVAAYDQATKPSNNAT